MFGVNDSQPSSSSHHFILPNGQHQDQKRLPFIDLAVLHLYLCGRILSVESNGENLLRRRNIIAWDESKLWTEVMMVGQKRS